MFRARRASSASASAEVSPAMLASSWPPPGLSFLRGIGRSLRRQQALGLGARLVGDLGTGEHAGNLLAALRPMELIKARDDAARLAAVNFSCGGDLGDEEMTGGARSDLGRMGDRKHLQPGGEAGEALT